MQIRLPNPLIFIPSVVLYAILMACIMQSCARAEDIVAITIAAEACGEGEKGMEAVAHVINNRSKAWSKTPIEIVTQKNQFYGATAENRYRLYSQCALTADRLATALKQGKLGQDFTSGAIYFRQPTENVMAWHKIKTFEYKNHIFYK